MPNSSGAAIVEQTSLQQSIFNAPRPGTTPSKPPPAADSPDDQVMADAATPEKRGQKRTREENDNDEEDSEGDVAMEEDSDEE